MTDKIKPTLIDTAIITGLELATGGALNQDTLMYAGGIGAGHNFLTKGLSRSYVPQALSMLSITVRML